MLYPKVIVPAGVEIEELSIMSEDSLFYHWIPSIEKG